MKRKLWDKWHKVARTQQFKHSEENHKSSEGVHPVPDILETSWQILRLFFKFRKSETSWGSEGQFWFSQKEFYFVFDELKHSWQIIIKT